MKQAPLPQLRQSTLEGHSDLEDAWIPEWSPKTDDKKGVTRGK
jgi:hypothetical protein